MIKSLRKKFILISMLASVTMLVLILGSINYLNYQDVNNRAEEVLEYLTNTDFQNEESIKREVGSQPQDDNAFNRESEINKNSSYLQNYFYVSCEDTEITTIDISRTDFVDEELATYLGTEALSQSSDSGAIDNYRYIKTTLEGQDIILFVDVSQDLSVFYSFLRISILISVISLIFVLALIILMSSRAIAPVAESYEKQKRFITDVSHELKTPLAIINTDVEVLEMDYGESKWTTGIKSQITRLNKLVLTLVSLAKMDEAATIVQVKELSLSKLVDQTINSYESIAIKNHKKIKNNINKGISYEGDENLLKQLFGILIDNAIKYSDGDIHINLYTKGKKIIFETINNGKNINKGNNNILFERFYRNDESRNSKTGGYGIGLSLAKSIVEKHHGLIKAESRDGKSLKITVEL